jgi:hypothetical protein
MYLWYTKKNTSACVIDTLTRYQADHGHIGNYGYLDIAHIWSDSSSQFTSSEFKQHCWEAGIHLSLAAPKKLHQNHLAEWTWQSFGTIARSLLVHARLPDSFMFHALLYSCHIFNVLPVKGLYSNGQVSTPYELFQGTKQRIQHFRVFGCPVIVRKWTAADKSNGKQTEQGIRGIFFGFELNQKGYGFYDPGSRQLYISYDIIFDEMFSSTLATTWRVSHNNLALRQVSSDIPLVTTTMEATGGLESYINPSFSGIEEGNIPSIISSDGTVQTSNTTPAIQDEQDDEPPELLHPDNDASDSDSEYDSDDDDDDIDDEDILAVTQPPTIVEEEATPQPLGV